MIIFCFLLSYFTYSVEKIIYAPQNTFKIASQVCTIKEHLIHAQSPDLYEGYKEQLEFFMWATPASNKNYILCRYKDKYDNYGRISKYKTAYTQGFHLIDKEKFSVIQFESDDSELLKTFVILNFTSHDFAHVNHLMDFLNIHRH